MDLDIAKALIAKMPRFTLNDVLTHLGGGGAPIYTPMPFVCRPTVIVFHSRHDMYRSGKENHRYSKCVQQITVGSLTKG